jgi:DNA-binding TFAR19-related protein (PDSD5 family)
MTQKKPQRLHERLGLSVEETLNRLIAYGQLNHKYKPIDSKHLEAVLNATPPKERNNG